MAIRYPTAHWMIALMTAVVITTPLVARQGPAPDPGPATPVKPAKPLTLTGCVTAEGAAGEAYTLREKKGGIAYHLMGMKTFAYEGRRVRIVGGLYPSPNLAGQAGAIDPTQAAMAAATPGRMGTIGQPLEFRVSEIRPVRGACPPLK